MARDLAGLGTDPAALLHSTSWRFRLDKVVLTYAAVPDPDPAGACDVRATLDSSKWLGAEAAGLNAVDEGAPLNRSEHRRRSG